MKTIHWTNNKNGITIETEVSLLFKAFQAVSVGQGSVCQHSFHLIRILYYHTRMYLARRLSYKHNRVKRIAIATLSPLYFPKRHLLPGSKGQINSRTRSQPPILSLAGCCKAELSSAQP